MLFNPGRADLEIIEVQSGKYSGDGEIVSLNCAGACGGGMKAESKVKCVDA